MGRSHWLSVLIFVVIATAPSAQAQGVLVMGRLDCGEWVEARKGGKAVSVEHWVIGTLNGLALGKQREFWKANGVEVSQEAVFLWMDNYCNAHPLDLVTAGIVTLFRERVGE